LQQDLGDMRVMMDDLVNVAMSGIVVASTIETTNFTKIARWFDGDDGFYRVCMRFSLRVY
jgi:hypothetical protein